MQKNYGYVTFLSCHPEVDDAPDQQITVVVSFSRDIQVIDPSVTTGHFRFEHWASD